MADMSGLIILLTKLVTNQDTLASQVNELAELVLVNANKVNALQKQVDEVEKKLLVSQSCIPIKPLDPLEEPVDDPDQGHSKIYDANVFIMNELDIADALLKQSNGVPCTNIERWAYDSISRVIAVNRKMHQHIKVLQAIVFRHDKQIRHRR
jgi:hypothetical protein